jgi:hypothetical protein
LALALLAAALLAVARGRRLGTPVAEPLPVLVPAAEAVTGRGRLYQRIEAREATLAALRGAAVARIARTLNPHAPAPPAGAPGALVGTLIEQVAARTGTPDHVVRAILNGPAPDDDEGLRRAVADLDALVNAVLRDNPPQPLGGTP